MSFINKVVLITGASSGIGAATAVEFAKNGANVSIVGRNIEKLNNVSELCAKSGSKPLVIKADIGNDAECQKIIDQVMKTFGRLDILVNNAGFLCIASMADGTMLEAYDKTMRVNVRAHVAMTSLAAPHLIESKGNIINISSVGAHRTISLPGRTPYCVSKAALSHFTRCIATELASKGVRINTVSPGPVKTDFFENSENNDVNIDAFADLMPLKRVSESEEIADIILFLASDKAIGITGSEFTVDNGFLIGK